VSPAWIFESLKSGRRLAATCYPPEMRERRCLGDDIIVVEPRPIDQLKPKASKGNLNRKDEKWEDIRKGKKRKILKESIFSRSKISCEPKYSFHTEFGIPSNVIIPPSGSPPPLNLSVPMVTPLEVSSKITSTVTDPNHVAPLTNPVDTSLANPVVTSLTNPAVNSLTNLVINPLTNPIVSADTHSVVAPDTHSVEKTISNPIASPIASPVTHPTNPNDDELQEEMLPVLDELRKLLRSSNPGGISCYIVFIYNSVLSLYFSCPKSSQKNSYSFAFI
jgi:hypothetical protein